MKSVTHRPVPDEVPVVAEVTALGSRSNLAALVFDVMVVVAFVEFGLMLLFWALPVTLSSFWVATLDATALAAISGPLLWWKSVRPLRDRLDAQFQRAEASQAALSAEIGRRESDVRLSRALEMAEDEQAVLEVVERAVVSTIPDHAGELLLADSSHSHLQLALTVGNSDPPRCPVVAPRDCVAVRESRVRTFASSETLDACPKLRAREGGSISAVCVPVSVLGRSVGVLHITGTVNEPPQQEVEVRLHSLIAATGTRLGLLRALADSESQAATDPLTGLANRRTMENRLSTLKRTGHPYTILMADLDHFKKLNDTYGHEVGDRALRVFARVLRHVVRADDMAVRYGGEEFVCVLTGAGTETGVVAAERIQTRLSEFLRDSSVPEFTVSIGVAAALSGANPAEVLQTADDALYQAKQNGRERVEVAPDSRDNASRT